PGAAALAALEQALAAQVAVGGDDGAAADRQAPGQLALGRQALAAGDAALVDGPAEGVGELAVERARALRPPAQHHFDRLHTTRPPIGSGNGAYRRDIVHTKFPMTSTNGLLSGLAPRPRRRSHVRGPLSRARILGAARHVPRR